MYQKSDSGNVFLQIGFRSPERLGSLRTIELFGIPGNRLADGKYIVSEEIQNFFDNLIVRQLFRDSRRLASCNFEHLKIWLYDMSSNDQTRGYNIPTLDKHDLIIYPNFISSKLRQIFVLNNELTGLNYENWKKTAESLFIPLFRKFLIPPEAARIPQSIPFGRLVNEIAGRVDPYLEMKKTVFFNALIIQID